MLYITGKFRIENISKKTKAKFWENRVVGDVIEIKVPLNSHSGSNGIYATYATITCGNETTENSLSQINKNLDNFVVTPL